MDLQELTMELGIPGKVKRGTQDDCINTDTNNWIGLNRISLRIHTE